MVWCNCLLRPSITRSAVSTNTVTSTTSSTTGRAAESDTGTRTAVHPTRLGVADASASALSCFLPDFRVFYNTGSKLTRTARWARASPVALAVTRSPSKSDSDFNFRLNLSVKFNFKLKFLEVRAYYCHWQ